MGSRDREGEEEKERARVLQRPLKQVLQYLVKIHGQRGKLFLSRRIIIIKEEVWTGSESRSGYHKAAT